MQIRRQESSKFQDSMDGLQQQVFYTHQHQRKPLKVYMDKQTDTESLIQSKEPSDNQRNTKILVYGKNIALTFDCRNQNFAMESLTKAMKWNTSLFNKEVNIEIGKPSDADADIYKKVMEGNSKSREVKYVSILNPPTPKKVKTESSVVLISKTPDKDTEGKEHQTRKSLSASIENVSNSKEIQIEKDDILTECEGQLSHQTGGGESGGENTDKMAVLSVVKRDQKCEEVEPEDEDRIYKCDLCSASFSRMGNYTRHRMIHTVNTQDNYRYKCSECGRLFLQCCDMKRHMLIHTKQEPYRCTVCDKGYIRKSDLVVHMRFHSKEKAYKCNHC